MRHLLALVFIVGCSDRLTESTTPTELATTASAGTLPGSLVVGASGSSSYTIPLSVPDGRAGVQPSLALVYSSGGGNGLVGTGWGLSGLSSITRCGRTVGREGEHRPVELTGNDNLCLDGARLVAINGPRGATNTIHRTERDAFAEIVSLDSDAYGAGRFVVRQKDGRILSYGATADGRVEAQSSVTGARQRYAWLLTRVEDRFGNYMSITYGHAAGATTIGYWPARIDYTGRGAIAPNRSVVFTYEVRPDVQRGWMRGMAVVSDTRLRSIQTYAPAEQGLTPTRVLSYELAYDTSPLSGRSRLTEVRVCDASNACLPPTRLTYSGSATPQFRRVTAGAPDFADREPIIADIDGDSRDDLVYKDKTADPTAWKIRRSNGNGFDPAIAQTLEGDSPIAWDANADGTAEIFSNVLQSSWPYHALRARRWDGGSFVVDPTLSTVDPLDVNAPIARHLLADVNGDMRPDYLSAAKDAAGTESWSTLSLYANGPFTYAGWGNMETPQIANVMPAEHAKPIDIDGDGHRELLVPHWTTTSSGGYSSVSGRYDVLRWSPWLGSVDIRPTNLDVDACAVFVDVNGDALVDVVSTTNWQVRENLGDGSFGAGHNALDPSTPTFDAGCRYDTSIVANKGDFGARVVDYDQDGRQDILLLGKTPSTSTVWVLRSTATGFKREQVGSISVVPTSRFSQTLDINGDGLFDILIGSPNTTRAVEVRIQETPITDLLVGVTDGFGAQRTLEYAPLTQTGYARPVGCTYPIACYLGPSSVVTREWIDNGSAVVLARTFQYVGGRVDMRGDGFLGFDQTIVTDARTGAQTTTTYELGPTVGAVPYVYRGMPREIRTTVPDGTKTHVFTTTTTYASRALAGNTHFVWPLITTREDAESEGGTTTLRSRTTTTVAVDDYANPTNIAVDRGAGFVTTTTRTVRNDTSRWLLGLVDIETTSSATPNGTAARKVTNVSDLATGVLLESVSEPGSALELHTIYERDAAGSVTAVTVRDAANRSRTGRTTYDADGVFAIEQLDAAGHRTRRTWRPGLGVVATETDPNGLVTAFGHDGLGRLRSVLAPDGTSRQVEHSSQSGYPFVETATATDGSRTVLYRDRLGRDVLTTDIGFGGAMRSVATTYDALGRVALVTRPYATGAPVKYAARYEYDALGRVRFQRQDDASKFVEYRYAGRAVDTYDEDLTHKRIERDLAGHPVVTTIYPLGIAASTTFAYGPFDTLVSVVDAQNNLVTMEYDVRGRRTRTVDEDIGSRRVTYDAFGDAIAEVDAAGNTTQMTYDALGRMISRTAFDGTDTWTWDTNSIGRLAASARGSITRTHLYDALGRPALDRWTVDSASYDFEYGYDTQGRLARVTYPAVPGRARVVADTRFDAWGQPTDVVVDGRSIWTALAVDAENRVTRERLGNGLVTTRTFDAATGTLTRIETPSVHDARYAYSPSGNLVSRTDGWLDKIETFTYDTNDRLVRAAITNQPAVAYSYSTIGNITAASDLLGCSLQYGEGAAGPHALTTLACGASTYHLTYDANGNVTRSDRDNLNAAWFSFGKPSELANPTGRIRYAYDADHIRVKKETLDSTNTTSASGLWGRVLALGDYEERSGGAMTSIDHVFYIRAAGRRVAQLIFRRPTTTTAASEEVDSLDPTGADVWQFFHTDLQGTIERTTADNAMTIDRASHDVFGARRNPAWSGGVALPSDVRQGYTGHNTDDEFGLVDMGGRIYHPILKRFLSADPLVADPFYGPSWNRYAYVYGNPTRYTDPTGHAADGGPIYAGMATFAFFNGMTMAQLGSQLFDARVSVTIDGIGRVSMGRMLEGAPIVDATREAAARLADPEAEPSRPKSISELTDALTGFTTREDPGHWGYLPDDAVAVKDPSDEFSLGFTTAVRLTKERTGFTPNFRCTTTAECTIVAGLGTVLALGLGSAALSAGISAATWGTVGGGGAVFAGRMLEMLDRAKVYDWVSRGGVERWKLPLFELQSATWFGVAAQRGIDMGNGLSTVIIANPSNALVWIQAAIRMGRGGQ